MSAYGGGAGYLSPDAAAGGARDYSLERRMRLLATAVPQLVAGPGGADSAFALASATTDDSEMLRGAVGAVQTSTWQRNAAELAAQPPDAQLGQWEQMTPDMRRLLSDNGYKPPEPSTDERSHGLGINIPFFGDSEDILLGGRSGLLASGGRILERAQSSAANAGGDLLHAMDVAGDTVAGRPFRTEKAQSPEERYANDQLMVENALANLRNSGYTLTDREADQLRYNFWQSHGTHYWNLRSRSIGVLPAPPQLDLLFPGGSDRRMTDGGFGEEMIYRQPNPNTALPQGLQGRFDAIVGQLSQSERYSPSWRAAFQRTATGEDWIRPSAQLDALHHLDGDWSRFDLALRLAQGATLDEIVRDQGHLPGTMDYTQAFTAAAQDAAAVSDQVEQLSGGTYSFGRGFAEDNQLPHGSVAYTAVSGMADALAVTVLDPMLILGKANAARRELVAGIASADRVGEAVRESRALYRTHQAANAGLAGRRVYHVAFTQRPTALRTLDSEARRGVVQPVLDRYGITGRFLTPSGDAGEALAMSYDKVDTALSEVRRDAMVSARAGALAERSDAEALIADVEAAREELRLARVTDLQPTTQNAFLRMARTRAAEGQYRSAERISRAFREWRAATPDVAATPFADLRREMPSIPAGLGQLLRWDEYLHGTVGHGIESADDVLDFYTHAQYGLDALIKGHVASTATTTNLLELPRLTRTAERTNAIRRHTEDVVDWAADADRLWTGFGGHAAALPAQMAGRTLKSLTQRMPANGLISFVGPQAEEEFARFVEMGAFSGMPASVRRRYLEDFIAGGAQGAGGSVAGRVQAVKTFMNDLFERAQIYENPKMREWANDLMARLDTNLDTAHRYAPDGVDIAHAGSFVGDVRGPVLPVAQHSTQMAIPDFDLFLANTHRTRVMAKVWRGINNSTVDAFMGAYWKPAMLLKLGFIPRAAGEEALAFIARENFIDAPRAFLASSVTGERYGALEAPMAFLSAMPARLRKGLGHIPFVPSDEWEAFPRAAFAYHEATRHATVQHWMRAAIADPRFNVSKVSHTDHLRFWGHFAAARATAYGRLLRAHLVDNDHLFAALATRNFADSRIMDLMLVREPELLDSAVRAMRYPAVQTAFAQLVDGRHMAMGGHSIDDLTTPTIAYAPNARSARNAELVPIKVTGQWEETEITKALADEIAIPVAYQIQHNGSDPTMIAARRAVRGMVHPDTLRSQVAPMLHESLVGSGELEDVVSGLRSIQTDVGALKLRDRRALIDVASGAPAERVEGFRQAIDDIPIDRLPPTLARLAIDAEDDSALAVVLTRAAYDEDFAALAEQVMKLPDNPRQLVLGNANIRVGSVSEARAAVVEAIGTALRDPEWSRYVRDQHRTRYLRDRTPVIEGPSEGTRSYYQLMADRETIDALSGRLNWQDGAVRLLAEINATDPEVRRFLARIFLEHDTQTQAGLADMAQHLGGSRLVPLGTIAHTDDRVVARAAEALKSLEVRNEGARVIAPAVVQVPDFHRMDPAAASVLAAPRGERLWNLDPTVSRQAQALTDFQRQWRFNDLGQLDPQGTHLVVGATYDEALDDFAETIADDFEKTFTHNDEVLDVFSEPLFRGDFSLDTVRRNGGHLPKSVVHPVMFAERPENFYQRMLRFGFDHVIGGSISALIRRPLFTHNLAVGYRAARPLERLLRREDLYAAARQAMADGGAHVDFNLVRNLWRSVPANVREDIDEVGEMTRQINRMYRDWDRTDKLDHDFDVLGEMDDGQREALRQLLHHDEWVERRVTEAAMHRALSDTIPYIDDHRIRSYYQSYARNLTPFWFAQEQFLKRWARTLKHSPEALRRAQLITQGFSQSAFVHTNDRGERVAVLPLSEEAGLLGGRIFRFFGAPAQIPHSPPLTMNIDYALPGVGAGSDVWNSPSLGPVAAIPLAMAINRYPELQGAGTVLLGQRGMNRSVAEQVFPSWALRGPLAFADPNYDSRLTAATIGAMQMMESESIRLRRQGDEASKAGDAAKAQDLYARAAELSPPDGPGADPRRVQAWIDETKNWSRTLLLTQSMFSFVSPGGASVEWPTQAQDELRELFNGMDFDQALATWLTEHPDAGPYSVFSTAKDSAAPLPPTQAALDFLQTNREWVESFPLAGPWLLPQPDAEDPFSQQAWNEMLAMGLRHQKTPEEWVDDYHFAASAGTYFDSLDRFNAQMMAAEGQPEVRGALQASWDAWSEAYKTTHPLFAAQLTGEARTRREQTLDQLATALADPDGPQVEGRDEVAEMIGSYQRFKESMAALAGNRSADAGDARDMLRASFSSWGERYIRSHPRTMNLWRALVEPAADLRDARVARSMLPPGYAARRPEDEAIVTGGGN